MVAPRLQFGQPNPWWSSNQTPQAQQPLNPQAQQMGQIGPNVAPGAYQGQQPPSLAGSGYATTGRGQWWNSGQQPQMSYQLAGQTTNPDGSVTTNVGGSVDPISSGAKAPWLTSDQKRVDQQQPNASPTPTAEFNPATAGGGGQDPKWQALASGMIRNGWGLDPVGARQNNGIIVGYGTGNQTTIIMPTDYNYGQDTARWEVAGAGVETALQRALRKTADEMSWNPNLNSMQVLAKWMRFVDQEARQQGKSSGFNMAQMGGQGLDPNTAGKPTSATAPPAGTAPPPAAGGNGPAGDGTGVPTSSASRGRYDDKAILAAAGDQQMGYDMLMEYLTGTTDEGTGPFAGFLEDFYKPIATGLINAMAAKNGGKVPTNIDDLFAAIKSGSGPGATTDLYSTMSTMAREAMQAQLGGSGKAAFSDLTGALNMYSPLMTRNLNPLAARMYQRQMGNTLRAMQAPSYRDMLGQNQRNYGQEFLADPFFQRWWQQ